MIRLTAIVFTLIFSACSVQKNYTIKKEGTDIILNGRVNAADLNNAKLYPWYYYGVGQYKTNKPLINNLKPIAEEIGVLIFGGTWCADTQLQLPKLMSVLKDMQVPENRIEIIMVDRNKECNTFNTKSVELKHVPTVIFFKDGKEQGRIIENPKSTFEEDMMNIFRMM